MSNETLRDETLYCGNEEKAVDGTGRRMKRRSDGRRSTRSTEESDVLGTPMHSLWTSPAARKWTGLGLQNIVCFVLLWVCCCSAGGKKKFWNEQLRGT